MTRVALVGTEPNATTSVVKTATHVIGLPDVRNAEVNTMETNATNSVVKTATYAIGLPDVHSAGVNTMELNVNTLAVPDALGVISQLDAQNASRGTTAQHVALHAQTTVKVDVINPTGTV